ncbi:MAG: hypothetical protein IJ322_01360 [Clostridia bacterium]|nr:hypothetical protein [Clostridia bacterium]
MISRNYKYDPVEDTEQYQAIKDELEAKIFSKMGGQINRGNAHLYVLYKKEILLADYGIEWKSPQELNPQIRFN